MRDGGCELQRVVVLSVFDDRKSNHHRGLFELEISTVVDVGCGDEDDCNSSSTNFKRTVAKGRSSPNNYRLILIC